MSDRVGLQSAVQGDEGRVISITWPDANLTGTTITATKHHERTGSTTSVTGTVAFVSYTAPSSTVSWTLSAADTGTSGDFRCQFTATKAGVVISTFQSAWYVEPRQDATAVAAPGLVGVPTGDAAWLATSEAGGALGTAAYAATGDFDAAGSAATVQGNLTTHIGATTGAHGSTAVGDSLRAAVDEEAARAAIGGGATGAAVFQAATVDAARAELGLAAVALPPRYTNHNSMIFSTTDVAGGATAGNTTNTSFNLATSTTANSRIRYRINNNSPILGRARNFVDWTRKNIFTIFMRPVAMSNAEGIFIASYGKRTTDAFGEVGAADYVAVKAVGGNVVEGIVFKVGVKTTVTLTTSAIPSTGVLVTIISENGTVTWYADGVEIGTTAAGPVTTSQDGTINFEINNGATAANYALFFTSDSECN